MAGCRVQVFSLILDSLVSLPMGIQSAGDLVSETQFQTFFDILNTHSPAIRLSWRQDKHILELLELSVKNNDFEFNNQTFLQIPGTAMGKKFAPGHANLFMAQWENTALEKCYKKTTITMYFRYLDDIWILGDHGETQFQTFFDILNTHSPAIRLSARVEIQ